ncbi:MAG TPA: helix-turn-helix domain-containing protein [Beijerinckiaceae bacterium]|nr:helix-turn-helix domain-containing protein [Beijerinckiaceae bacterium]
MDIRPIRTEQDHAKALAELERLWGAPEGTPDGDKLDVLATLVEAFEAKNWSVPASTPIDVIRYAIDEMGHSQSDLAELLGSRSRASEVLAGKRALTVEMIHKISTSWRISADLLARPYRLAA